MKQILKKISPLLTAVILMSPHTSYAEKVLPTANGIKYPVNLKNWRLISTSFRSDNNTQRAILGNSVAVKAARSGQTDPWPKGTILAKLVWKNRQHELWNSAIVPGKFVHSEIMIKDAKKYKSTGGWGFARWLGKELKPYGDNASFSQECYSCHLHAKTQDLVFTKPPLIP